MRIRRRQHKRKKYDIKQISTMALLLSAFNTYDDYDHLIQTPNFVYCPTPAQNFRAGESVLLQQPIFIGNTGFSSQVGAIMEVDQSSEPQRLCLSLFLNKTDPMNLIIDPPEDRPYIQYPNKQVVWTLFTVWIPVYHVSRVVFLFAPWEINNSHNDAAISYGMFDAYCVIGRFFHLNPPHEQAFQLLGHDMNYVTGCLHMIQDVDCITVHIWSFKQIIVSVFLEKLSKPSLSARTSEIIKLGCISHAAWDHFVINTLEATQKLGVLTKRVPHSNCNFEVMRDRTVKYWSRFGTENDFILFSEFFGTSIRAALRLKTPRGPTLSVRNGPIPAYLAKRVRNQHSLGCFFNFEDDRDDHYHTTDVGVDLLYVPSNFSLTIHVQFEILFARQPDVKAAFCDAQLIDGGEDGELLHIDITQFQFENVVYIVRNIDMATEIVNCEAISTENDDVQVGLLRPFAANVVVQLSDHYNNMDVDDDDMETDNSSAS